jgi:hypothetical protein
MILFKERERERERERDSLAVVMAEGQIGQLSFTDGLANEAARANASLQRMGGAPVAGSPAKYGVLSAAIRCGASRFKVRTPEATHCAIKLIG